MIANVEVLSKYLLQKRAATCVFFTFKTMCKKIGYEKAVAKICANIIVQKKTVAGPIALKKMVVEFIGSKNKLRHQKSKDNKRHLKQM